MIFDEVVGVKFSEETIYFNFFFLNYFWIIFDVLLTF